MTLLYQFALFLHIIGGFGLMAAITVETIGLRGLRQATQRTDALVWLGLSRSIVMRLTPSSLGLILVSGLYMVATVWGPDCASSARPRGAAVCRWPIATLMLLSVG